MSFVSLIYVLDMILRCIYLHVLEGRIAKTCLVPRLMRASGIYSHPKIFLRGKRSVLYIISTLFKFQPLFSYKKQIVNLDLNVFLESDHMGHLNHDSGNVA